MESVGNFDRARSCGLGRLYPRTFAKFRRSFIMHESTCRDAGTNLCNFDAADFQEPILSFKPVLARNGGS